MDELLTGKPAPITNAELGYWSSFWKIKTEIQEKESKQKGAKAVPEGPRLKKTMGS